MIKNKEEYNCERSATLLSATLEYATKYTYITASSNIIRLRYYYLPTPLTI